eukprot:CAMPEP_0175994588 /NCGR_PEP_ID=MMETSP0108-20121206/54673_1 /TAXON_ID=195067 ORGANISM="Goniomonas pacifica, Strain CCMP1869" /NCGR_SAMPLE_ID=MMETSP0108 /ASSEMBLY_ACC=CAM_ASM_000204 /LENGTH=441 /DNA_ID=CAMNT_0017326643 /DNA_START=20 /DNA_END=1346 /DNA_ORIENTATION=+
MAFFREILRPVLTRQVYLAVRTRQFQLPANTDRLFWIVKVWRAFSRLAHDYRTARLARLRDLEEHAMMATVTSPTAMSTQQFATTSTQLETLNMLHSGDPISSHAFENRRKLFHFLETVPGLESWQLDARCEAGVESYKFTSVGTTPDSVGTIGSVNAGSFQMRAEINKSGPVHRDMATSPLPTLPEHSLANLNHDSEPQSPFEEFTPPPPRDRAPPRRLKWGLAVPAAQPRETTPPKDTVVSDSLVISEAEANAVNNELSVPYEIRLRGLTTAAVNNELLRALRNSSPRPYDGASSPYSDVSRSRQSSTSTPPLPPLPEDLPATPVLDARSEPQSPFDESPRKRPRRRRLRWGLAKPPLAPVSPSAVHPTPPAAPTPVFHPLNEEEAFALVSRGNRDVCVTGPQRFYLQTFDTGNDALGDIPITDTSPKSDEYDNCVSHH